MDAKEVRRELLARAWDYLVSLPFDSKILQEAASDPDLDRRGREVAAGVLLHVLSHHEGAGPDRYLEDIFLVRAALHRLTELGGEGAAAFQERFAEVYGKLASDIEVFQQALGLELWQRVLQRIEGCSRLSLKGKRAAQYIDDEGALDLLYDEGLEFQTNYSVTEAQVQNRLRRPEQVPEYLQRRYAEDARKR